MRELDKSDGRRLALANSDFREDCNSGTLEHINEDRNVLERRLSTVRIRIKGVRVAFWLLVSTAFYVSLMVRPLGTANAISLGPLVCPVLSKRP